MTVNCIAKTEGKTNCPLIKTCLARLTDPTIVACGVPLWYAGLIRRDEVVVEHAIRERKDG